MFLNILFCNYTIRCSTILSTDKHSWHPQSQLPAIWMTVKNRCLSYTCILSPVIKLPLYFLSPILLLPRICLYKVLRDKNFLFVKMSFQTKRNFKISWPRRITLPLFNWAKILHRFLLTGTRFFCTSVNNNILIVLGKTFSHRSRFLWLK